MLTKKELSIISDMVADKVVERVKEELKDVRQPEMVDSKEAAKILGVCPDYLRRTKDRYPHIKSGQNKQGRILFQRDALLKSFAK